jgi:aspartokinase-like uncharacterized kinase
MRELDRRRGLGDETAHWLALQAMTFNGQFLAETLRKELGADKIPTVSGNVSEWPSLWSSGRVPIVDALEFSRVDEFRDGCLPHSWDVSSDSVAARVATVGRARRLVLLKSITIPDTTRWDEADRQGFVDPFFAKALGDYHVDAINFRQWTPRSMTPAHEPGPNR